MTLLRVAFFIDSLRPGAGTENQLSGILRMLDRRRFEPHLYTITAAPSPHLQQDLGVQVRHWDVPKFRSVHGIHRFHQLTCLLRHMKYHLVMTFFTDANIFVVPACLLSPRTVCVVSRRDTGYWNTPSLLHLLRLVNRRADYFLVNAHAVRSYVASVERFPIERIKVIPNALWNFTNYSLVPTLRSQLGLPPNRLLVGMVANLRPVKRPDRFLAVIELVVARRPDVAFVVFGDGPLRSEIERAVRERGLNERVYLLGNLPNVHDYLPSLDIGLLTSASEGLSNTLIEYAGGGVPAVAFNVGGNAEVIAESRTGYLLEDGDVSSMAERVLTLLGNKSLRAQMSHTARELAATRFSARAITQEWEEFLTVASTAPRRALTFA